MSYDEKGLRANGFGTSGNRHTPTGTQTNKLLDIMNRAKLSDGKLAITPTGTLFDADGKEIREAPQEVRDNVSHVNTLQRSF